MALPAISRPNVKVVQIRREALAQASSIFDLQWKTDEIGTADKGSSLPACVPCNENHLAERAELARQTPVPRTEIQGETFDKS